MKGNMKGIEKKEKLWVRKNCWKMVTEEQLKTLSKEETGKRNG